MNIKLNLKKLRHYFPLFYITSGYWSSSATPIFKPIFAAIFVSSAKATVLLKQLCNLIKQSFNIIGAAMSHGQGLQQDVLLT
jgi:hypothetical protein